MNSRTAAREENVQRACRFIARAATDGAELAVLPEMFHCEYFSHYRYMDYPEPDAGYTTFRIRASVRSLKLCMTFSASRRDVIFR